MTGAHRVLIVEDDPATSEDLAEWTLALGCEPVTTNNKLDAIAMLKEQTFCFVLLDLEIKIDPDSVGGHEMG